MSIDVANESGVSSVDEERLSRLARHVLDAMRVHPLAELSVVLVDEGPMTDLHVRWMDEPGPTDVLSFPMDELRPGGPGRTSDPGVLGSAKTIVVTPRNAANTCNRPGAAAKPIVRRSSPALVCVCGSGTNRLPIRSTRSAQATHSARAMALNTAKVARLTPCQPPAPTPAATLERTTVAHACAVAVRSDSTSSYKALSSVVARTRR